jgi:hypothetical protein
MHTTAYQNLECMHWFNYTIGYKDSSNLMKPMCQIALQGYTFVTGKAPINLQTRELGRCLCLIVVKWDKMDENWVMPSPHSNLTLVQMGISFYYKKNRAQYLRWFSVTYSESALVGFLLVSCLAIFGIGCYFKFIKVYGITTPMVELCTMQACWLILLLLKLFWSLGSTIQVCLRLAL